MDDTKYYLALEEDDANEERVKFFAWIAVVAIVAALLGFTAGLAAAEQGEPLADRLDHAFNQFVCTKYQIQGASYFPVPVNTCWPVTR